MTWDPTAIAALREQEGARGATEVVLIEGYPPCVLDLDGPLYADNPLLAAALEIKAERDRAQADEAPAAKAQRNRRVLDWYDDLAAAVIVQPKYYHRSQVARGVRPGDGLTVRDLVAAPGALSRLVDAIYPAEVLAPLATFPADATGDAGAPDVQGVRPTTRRSGDTGRAAPDQAVVQRGRVGQGKARRGAAVAGKPARSQPQTSQGSAS